MKRRVTYRPGKAQGTFSMIVGGIFVLIGLFVVIPSGGGIFGVLWTIAAAVITGMTAYQTFGKGYVGPEINIEEEEEQSTQRPASPPPAETHDHIPSMALDAKSRLRQLEDLKGAGLIGEQEYRQKREEILKGL